MAQTTHKSATSVTLAPLAEKTPFERFVLKYWPYALLFAVVISVWVIYRNRQGQERKQVLDKSWDDLNARAAPQGFPALPTATPAVFDTLANELRDRPVAPWARWLEANAAIAERDYVTARAALDKLRAEHPTHALVADAWDFGGPQSEAPVDYLARSLGAREAWEAQHAELFANPPIPGDAVRVRLKTDQGDIVLAVYPSSAPEQVANFLKNVDAGYYNGTKFHRIDPQLGLDGGDPNSLQADPTAWGQGGEDQILPYVDTQLYHFAGAVSAARGASAKESLGSQFSILTSAQHALDGTRVVFGVVESGLEIARQIAAGEVVENTNGQPKLPVTIAAAERL